MNIRIIILTIFSIIWAQGYNVQLLGHLPYGQETSDITGFYQDGREIAVMGLQNAAAFIDITDPYNPVELVRISGGNSIWRDIKYFDRHVYIGTEAADGHARMPQLPRRDLHGLLRAGPAGRRGGAH